MGAYLSKPITEKVSSDEEGEYIKCGCSSMQGWEGSQQDAHNCIIDYYQDFSLFTIYDGHGGHEVAEYCLQNFPNYLKESASFKNGNYSKALKEAFLGFDATLTQPDVVASLKEIAEEKKVFYLKKIEGLSPLSPFARATQPSKMNLAEESSSCDAGSSSCCNKHAAVSDKCDKSFLGAEESSNESEETQWNGRAEEENEDEEEEEEDDLDGGDYFEVEAEPGVTSGSTALVALLHGRYLYVANAGNSRCVVCRAGKALDMSLDHTPADITEKERILNAGGYIRPDGTIYGFPTLSRAIGIYLYKQLEDFPIEKQMIIAHPDVRTLSLVPTVDEFMVLACQGIWETMSSQDVVTFVRKRLMGMPNKELSTICEELFNYCLAPKLTDDGPGTHNMTMIIIQFLPSLANASANLPNTAIKAVAAAPGKNQYPKTPSADLVDCLSSKCSVSFSEDSCVSSVKQKKKRKRRRRRM